MPNRLRLLTLTCLLALIACGPRGAAPPSAASHARHPAATADLAPRERAATQAAPRADSVAEGESVGDATFSISPVAGAVAATVPATVPGIPARWVEGKNYQTLVPDQPTSAPIGKVEVIEVFWYGCPHCYRFDPALEAWRKKGRPAFVEFTRMPVIWTGNVVNRSHARLYYTIEALGKLDELHAVVFHEIHENQNPLVDPRDAAHTEQMQKAFLVAHGVSAADFDRTYRSIGVEAKLQHAEQFTQRYQALGVPTIVVNGKYTSDLGLAGGEAELLTLVNDLAASERRH